MQGFPNMTSPAFRANRSKSGTHLVQFYLYREQIFDRLQGIPLPKFLGSQFGMQTALQRISGFRGGGRLSQSHTQERMHHLLIFIPKAIYPQFTGIFPLRAPIGHIDFRIAFLKTSGPLAAGTIVLSHVHHYAALTLGNCIRVVNIVGTTTANRFSYSWSSSATKASIRPRIFFLM